MLVLGINGGFRPGYQDTSAVLCKNGEILYAVEEERFNRVKHAPGQIPEQSIHWILKAEKKLLKDIDLIATHGSSFGEEFEKRLKNYFLFYFKTCPPILKVSHHLAHAASTYYASGFSDAMILTVDSSGDGISTQTATGKGKEIQILNQWKRPQSLGIFYSMITQFCGFRRDTDEYKLMGLSAFGKPAYMEDLSKVLRVEKGHYELDESYLQGFKKGKPQPHRQEPLFSNKLSKILKLEPLPYYSEKASQSYSDLACSAQKLLEKALIELISDLHAKTGLKRLCLAGGVALNCLANQKLAELGFIEDIYVQPASSDAGVSLGAAYLGSLENGIPLKPFKSPFLGPSYSQSDILNSLKLCQMPFENIEDPAEIAAREVHAGKVVGWFQGAMEFGPRALGARSILASPFQKNMKDTINAKIKFREAFRPFGPSLLMEEKENILKSPLKELPYMTITSGVHEKWWDSLSPIVHKDHTTRPQTVTEKQNPLFYKCLKKIKELSGTGIVINTSFNRNREPIVNTPKEALASFQGSGMDSLVIGNFLLKKQNNSHLKK